jgi:acetyl-CoA synthetase
MPDTPDRHAPPADFRERAHVASSEAYRARYDRSIADPEGFWAGEAQRLHWETPFHTVKNTRYTPGDVSIRWFEGGRLNACYNCVDRHVIAGHGDRVALIFEKDDPDEAAERVTYGDLLARVQTLAGVLKAHGVGRGDRVTIYMPMTPDAVVAMLACARIGAVHSVVFGGFSPDSLADRILDGDAHVVITADEARRGGRTIGLKAAVDTALERCPDVHTVLVVRNTGADVSMTEGRDHWLDEASAHVPATCPCEWMNAEDPLFILYTSGSTGKPKGVLHTTGGYLLYASLTHALVFDLQPDDVFFCTADVGWITGHSYVTYGPLANGCTQVIFEGIPTWPDASRFWRIVDRHGVTILYTAPTAIRALMAKGDAPVKATSRQSLRLLGTVGEPINPEAWRWYSEVVGEGRCPVVDTWWQTETGGILLVGLPGAVDQKPGKAGLPFFGVQPEIVDAAGNVLEGEAEGLLLMKDSWPGQMRTVYGDHERFMQTYFSQYPDRYFTGDGCRRDEDGYYQITGRVDDVINVSGHRLGTAEIESALVLHPAVAEAAVVGFPHDIKGQGIHAYVTLVEGQATSDALRDDLRQQVRRVIGPLAQPDRIQFAPGLPKTRSGKIMRRILRKIAEGDTSSLGDTSTLADPAVVDDLVANRAG